MSDNRPVFLNLTKMKFPVPAITSILHRISGVLMFLFLPLLFYLLSVSLKSSASFDAFFRLVGSASMKLILWVGLSAVIYHIFAGLRHLFMDFGFGETLQAGRVTAYAVIILGVVGAVIAGVWIW